MMAIYKGDVDSFGQYGENMCKAIGFTGTKDYSAKEKAIIVIMLAKGGDFKDPRKLNIAEPSMRGDYERIFLKLFGTQARKALLLHKLVSMSKSDLLRILEIQETYAALGGDMAVLPMPKEYYMVNDLFNGELYRKFLRMDKQSIDWVRATMQLSLSEVEGLVFIATEMELTSLKLNQYRGLCSKSSKLLRPVFKKLNHLIPIKLSEKIIEVLNGDVQALAEIIRMKVTIEENFSATWFNVHRKGLDEEETESFAHFKVFLKAFYDTLTGEGLNLDDLKIVFDVLGLDYSYANVFLGYNAILNENHTEISMLFNYGGFERIPSPVVEALVSLASKTPLF